MCPTIVIVISIDLINLSLCQLKSLHCQNKHINMKKCRKLITLNPRRLMLFQFHKNIPRLAIQNQTVTINKLLSTICNFFLSQTHSKCFISIQSLMFVEINEMQSSFQMDFFLNFGHHQFLHAVCIPSIVRY